MNPNLEISHTQSHQTAVLTEGDFTAYLNKSGARLVPAEYINKYLPQLEGQFSSLFYKGNLELLTKPCVSVVGTRSPTAEGIARTRKVVSILVDLGYVVISGLAKGIDTIAHKTALDQRGLTAAIMGTPIHKIYPAENKLLASEIEQKGLLLSPAQPHEESGRYLFPRRNRLMALLSQATIIIEAGETSGVIHQAAECLKQGRKLILLKSLVENTSLTWPAKFINSGAHIVESPENLKDILGSC